MSTKQRILCGTPELECTGGKLVTDQNFKARKYHPDRESAMQCHRNWLKKIGFKQLSSRELANPENGRIRILPKRTRFGGRLRTGKEGSRYMPNDKDGQCNRGIIF